MQNRKGYIEDFDTDNDFGKYPNGCNSIDNINDYNILTFIITFIIT